MRTVDKWKAIQTFVGVVPDGDPGVKTATAIGAKLGLSWAGHHNPSSKYTPEPTWFKKALDFLGQREIKGSRHNPIIVGWWKSIQSYFRDDETPWCAAFVGGIVEDCGITSTRSAAARSYENWGIELNEPATGAIVVYWRGSRDGWKGHVGFVRGIDAKGNILTLGGNQGDSVSIQSFPKTRVLSYRWPPGVPLPSDNAGVEIAHENYDATTGNEV